MSEELPIEAGVIGAAAKAIMALEDRADGERWDDFEPDAPAVLWHAHEGRSRATVEAGAARSRTRRLCMRLDAGGW